MRLAAGVRRGARRGRDGRRRRSPWIAFTRAAAAAFSANATKSRIIRDWTAVSQRPRELAAGQFCCPSGIVGALDEFVWCTEFRRMGLPVQAPGFTYIRGWRDSSPVTATDGREARDLCDQARGQGRFFARKFARGLSCALDERTRPNATVDSMWKSLGFTYVTEEMGRTYPHNHYYKAPRYMPAREKCDAPSGERC